MQKKVLITGGCGFIGSNLVESFINNENFSLVRVLDDLSTGKLANLQEFKNHPKLQFIEGDIRNISVCKEACKGIDLVSHQAALGSVPRSVKDPITSTEVNINGFINILWAAKEENIKRIVYASSSSVYGDSMDSPKVESKTGKVLSPYAATKMSNELIAQSFANNYGLTIIGLRYFNVFGPKQSPDGPYAAVIPLFLNAAIESKAPNINGDGTITRDFTPVSNVVQINQNALLKDLPSGNHFVFNVACGETTTLNQIWSIIEEISGNKVKPNYTSMRQGDILHSLADISLAKKILDYRPELNIKDAIRLAFDYYNKTY